MKYILTVIILFTNFNLIFTNNNIIIKKLNFDWLNYDEFIEPNFEKYFLKENKAGEKLSLLFKNKKNVIKYDNEILYIVKKGLKTTDQNKSKILDWICNNYIWEIENQNKLAIEIMYHACDIKNDNNLIKAAYYNGLAMVNNKSPNIIKHVIRLLFIYIYKKEKFDYLYWGLIERTHSGFDKSNQLHTLRMELKKYLENSKNKKEKEIGKILLRLFGFSYNKRPKSFLYWKEIEKIVNF